MKYIRIHKILNAQCWIQFPIGNRNITIYAIRSIVSTFFFLAIHFQPLFFRSHAIRTLVQIRNVLYIQWSQMEKLQWRLSMRKWKARTRRQCITTNHSCFFFSSLPPIHSILTRQKCPDAFCSILFLLHIALAKPQHWKTSSITWLNNFNWIAGRWNAKALEQDSQTL